VKCVKVKRISLTVLTMLRCERVSRTVLPAVRRALALELYRMGCSYSKIASLLHSTPAAISQYLKGKRGVGVRVPRELARAAARKILSGEDPGEVLCALCREVSARVDGA